MHETRETISWRLVQDPQLGVLRFGNGLKGYHWLDLVSQSCMSSR